MRTAFLAVLARSRLAAVAGVAVTMAIERAVAEVLLCENSLRFLEVIVGGADCRGSTGQ